MNWRDIPMIEMLRSRRSVRRFEDRPIEPERAELLTEALVRSPTSRSINPWEFIIVDDSQTKSKLSQCKPHGAGFLASAPIAVVILGDTSRSDTCIEDCSIAAITLQYAAEAMGLGSCWCQVRLRDHGEGKSAEEYVRELLDIPKNFLVECVLGIGYPAQSKEGHDHDSLDWGKVHNNRYGNR
jgi:nitroreductase